jgi:nucleotidyltransferase/DNA polymerase involved in DNA repair
MDRHLARSWRRYVHLTQAEPPRLDPSTKPQSTRPPIERPTTMRRLHLFLPHLPLYLARARRSEPFPTGPLVLGGRPWDPGPVIDADPTARALGVRRGMPLGSAHRLAPEATFIEPDPDADRGAAEAVFEALAQSSPSLAGTSDPLDVAFGLFEVGIDGLGPLWGPEPVLAERLAGAVSTALPGADGADLRPRIGIAGTHFAATVAAMAARPDVPVVVPPGDEPAFLADRPSGLLTTDPDVRARLTRFGLRRIGVVAELPRSALIARFGEEGARLHARANGQETDRFQARQATERLGLALPIEPPVEDLEPLRFVLHRLVTALTGQLTGRGLAADRAVLVLELDLAFAPTGTAPRIEVEQRFPEPTADPEAVERLLFARLEREPPAAAVGRLDLELRGTTPAAGQQLPLFVPQAARTARLGWQLARLALTYGEDRIRRVAITDPEAPLPEERWTWQAVGLDGEPA